MCFQSIYVLLLKKERPIISLIFFRLNGDHHQSLLDHQNVILLKQDSTSQSYFSILPPPAPNQTTRLNPNQLYFSSTSQPKNAGVPAQSDDDIKSSDYIEPASAAAVASADFSRVNNNGFPAQKSSDIVYTDLNNLQYIIQQQQQLLLSSLKDSTTSKKVLLGGENCITDDQKAATTTASTAQNGCSEQQQTAAVDLDHQQLQQDEDFEWKLKVRSDGSRYVSYFLGEGLFYD